MKKIDFLKNWVLQKRVFSTTDVKIWGINNFFTSADVRVRIDLIQESFIRAIPDAEARQRNLVREGNRNIRWYEVIESVPLHEVAQGKQTQIAFC